MSGDCYQEEPDFVVEAHASRTIRADVAQRLRQLV